MCAVNNRKNSHLFTIRIMPARFNNRISTLFENQYQRAFHAYLLLILHKQLLNKQLKQCFVGRLIKNIKNNGYYKGAGNFSNTPLTSKGLGFPLFPSGHDSLLRFKESIIPPDRE